MSTPADQSDVIAANERMTSELTTARTERDAATKERDAANASVSTLTAERDAALKERDDTKATLAKVTAERDALAAVDRDFNKRLAAELVKHGVRATPLPAAASQPAKAWDDVPAGSYLSQNLTALARAGK